MPKREEKVIETIEYLTELEAKLSQSENIVLIDQSLSAQILELRDKASKAVKDIMDTEKKRYQSIKQLENG